MAYPFFLAKLLARSGIARYLPAVKRWTDGGGKFVHYYSDRLLAAPFETLRSTAGFLESHGPDAIDLGQGTPRFDLAASGSTKLPADRRGWPPTWGLPELRDAVADHLRTEHRLAVHPTDEVFITAGATAAFNLALETFLNPGRRVVLFDPTSPLFALALRFRRACLHWIPTRMEEGRIHFRYENLIKALRGARLLVLNAPANPTGGVFAPADLEQIAWWANRRDVLIISDEVFARYCYEGAAVSIGTFPRARQRTLTLGSISQGYALASARVGWLAGQRHLVRPCALAAVSQAPFVPTVCQQIALAALRQDPATFRPVKEEFASKRRYTFERLRSLGLNATWPAGAFFFWIPVREFGLTGRQFAERLLAAKKVIVWPGEYFGPSGSGYVRLSYAGEDGRLREGLSRLAEFVRDLRGTPETPTQRPSQAA